MSNTRYTYIHCSDHYVKSHDLQCEGHMIQVTYLLSQVLFKRDRVVDAVWARDDSVHIRNGVHGPASLPGAQPRIPVLQQRVYEVDREGQEFCTHPVRLLRRNPTTAALIVCRVKAGVVGAHVWCRSVERDRQERGK